MHIPRPASIIRSIGNDGARANAEGALAHWAADRAAVENLEARLSLASDEPQPGSSSRYRRSAMPDQMSSTMPNGQAPDRNP